MVNYARLYVHVKGGEDSPLYHKYIQYVENHNNSIINNRYPNAGFDVFFPTATPFHLEKLNLFPWTFNAKCMFRRRNQL